LKIWISIEVRHVEKASVLARMNPSWVELLTLGTSLGVTENVQLVGGTSLSLRVFVPEPSNFVCTASNARSSLRRPYTLPRTEPPPHPRPLLPSSPKQTGGRYAGFAFSIPRRAPIESDQSDGSSSFHLANPFLSSRSTRLSPLKRRDQPCRPTDPKSQNETCLAP
jgi:hypothetical protein